MIKPRWIKAKIYKKNDPKRNFFLIFAIINLLWVIFDINYLYIRREIITNNFLNINFPEKGFVNNLINKYDNFKGLKKIDKENYPIEQLINDNDKLEINNYLNNSQIKVINKEFNSSLINVRKSLNAIQNKNKFDSEYYFIKNNIDQLLYFLEEENNMENSSLILFHENQLTFYRKILIPRIHNYISQAEYKSKLSYKRFLAEIPLQIIFITYFILYSKSLASKINKRNFIKIIYYLPLFVPGFTILRTIPLLKIINQCSFKLERKDLSLLIIRCLITDLTYSSSKLLLTKKNDNKNPILNEYKNELCKKYSNFKNLSMLITTLLPYLLKHILPDSREQLIKITSNIISRNNFDSPLLNQVKTLPLYNKAGSAINQQIATTIVDTTLELLKIFGHEIETSNKEYEIFINIIRIKIIDEFNKTIAKTMNY